MADRPRRHEFHFPVTYLVVPMAFPVGRVTFRPSGWAAERLRRDIARRADKHPWTEQRDLSGLIDWEWATAEVALTAKAKPYGPAPTGLIDEARDEVRDAIAVLRLYQRTCLPGWSLESQTFGLDIDIGSQLANYWFRDRKGFRGWGTSRHGVAGSWTFTREHVKGFPADARFALLHKCLRDGVPTGSLVARAIAAIRVLNYANVMLRQPLRIVLHAVALEALLGDEPPTPGESPRGQAHLVAQRAAFLTCPSDGIRLESGGTACVCLTAPSATQLVKDPQMARRPPQSWDWGCTEYWHIREVFEARNEALHEAADQFKKGTAERFEGRVDDVILAALGWAAAHPDSTLADLDAAVRRLPPRSA